MDGLVGTQEIVPEQVYQEQARAQREEFERLVVREWKPELMGQIVTVYTNLYRSSAGRNNMGIKKVWLPIGLGVPRAGWITGRRWMKEGYYSPSYGTYGPYDDYEPPTFAITKTVHVVLVVYWPTMNPIYVPLGGFVMGGRPRPTPPQEANYYDARLIEGIR